jgi:monoterpene epsilon-lactone hydrolase
VTQSNEEKSGIHVPARFIPTPSTVSPQAQAYLSNPPAMGGAGEPDPKDKAAWRSHTAQTNSFLTTMTAGMAKQHPAEIVTHTLSNAVVYELTPNSFDPGKDNRAIIYIHGGGFTVGHGIAAAYAASPVAGLAQMKVFSVDYRMPPDHPFPAGLDDSVEAYRMVLTRYKPQNIAVYGASAGGGLAASFILKARDLGLPLPGACALHSPEADLTESGDSFEANHKVDAILSRLTNSIALYADGHDLKDPYLSPLFGDFTKGFPPTILTTGTRDLFLSNTVNMHRALRRAGLKAELHVFEAMSHGGFMGTAPEDQEVQAEMIRFIDERLSIQQ